MTTVEAMRLRAKEIHQRLLWPPNAVIDTGIDLKRKKELFVPPVDKPVDNSEVLEHQPAYCKVSIVVTPPEDRKPLKINPILRAVSDHYGILIPEIKGDSRRMNHVRPRHVTFYIASRHTGMSIAAIGRRFDRDHTTVLHAVRKISERVLVDEDLAGMIRIIEAKLLAGLYDDKLDQHRSALATKSEPDLAKRWQEGVS